MKVTVKSIEDFDWNTSGLVKSIWGEDVVLTTGSHVQKHFSGFTLTGENSGYCGHLAKENFKPFRGTVTIEG